MNERTSSGPKVSPPSLLIEAAIDRLLRTTKTLSFSEPKSRGSFLCDMTESSSDTTVRTGGTAHFECQAEGYPTPKITWSREKEKRMKISNKHGAIKHYRRFEGATLTIPDLSPSDMGAYYCMANNTIPPIVSKRIVLNVQFAPIVRATEQLVGFVDGRDVTLKCEVRSYPESLIKWIHGGGIILNNTKFKVTETNGSDDSWLTILTIRSANREDMGNYKCEADNGIGVRQTIIRTYMLSPAEAESHSQTQKESSEVGGDDDDEPADANISVDSDDEDLDLDLTTGDKRSFGRDTGRFTDVNAIDDWTDPRQEPEVDRNRYEFIDRDDHSRKTQGEKRRRRKKKHESSTSSSPGMTVGSIHFSVLLVLIFSGIVYPCCG